MGVDQIVFEFVNHVAAHPDVAAWALACAIVGSLLYLALVQDWDADE